MHKIAKEFKVNVGVQSVLSLYSFDVFLLAPSRTMRSELRCTLLLTLEMQKL